MKVMTIEISALRKLLRIADSKLEIRVVRSASDWNDVRALRNQVYYHELGRIALEHIIDEFDAKAVLYNAYLGNRIVGTIRCMDPFASPLEIVETYPDIVDLIDPDKRYLEIGRLMTAKDIRNGVVSVRLYFQALKLATKVSADGVLLTCSPHLIRLYDKVGFRLLSPIPINRKYLLGAEDYIMIFDFEEQKDFYTRLRPLIWAMEEEKSIEQSV
ncbi:putative GNAT family N-acyltransferase [Paenibacillus harenae]|nr:putative GNAT family N-acyltransferase [Paenibacillus harenae]